MYLGHVALFIIFLALVIPINDGCDPGERVRGCKIFMGQCVCGNGCISEYRYTTRDECKRVLKGKAYDICRANPCANKGACTQTSTHPLYRCRCEGTGYYGPRCQHACPKPGSSGALKVFPYECIVI